MAVFRVEKNSGYTVMSNHHLRNRALSLKAKGLLSQMLSLPEDWDYTLQGLARINRESIDAIRQAIRELEQAGYIQRSRERDEKGRLRGADYVIFELPQPVPASVSPTLENPTLEKPTQENPTLENPMQLNLAKNFALSFMLIVFVMTIYVPAGIILLIADLLLIPGLWLSFRMVQKYGKEKNDICAENVSSIVEYVSGIQTFRAYGVGGMKNKTVINAMREFSRISFVYEAKVLPIGTGFGILSWLSCPLVIWLAYTPWAVGTLNTVDYLLICMLPLFCAKLANSIFVDLTSYKNLMISKNKILGVMNEPEETGSMEPLHTTTHEIIFDNVDFSYVPGEPVLKHATFTVPDQKLTAIVGDSGSGKSTILNLIAKYYEATGGTISIGGKPINHVAAERVLEQVSMVDQDVFLFDDTIRDNIRHARPNATDAEIETACREANCDSFIRKMEKGYDTLTGENGNLLSGGERQRISIARAILKNSPILLLDEATASLDIENELAVKQAIANLLKEKKTVVMIAHTLSIVKNADQILVMGDGRIAESGTHEELLAKGGKYAAMWNAEQKISA